MADPNSRNPSIPTDPGVLLGQAGLDTSDIVRCDVHMTDLVEGREDLSDVNLIVFVGGFSNSDVLGSAKGWAGYTQGPNGPLGCDGSTHR